MAKEESRLYPKNKSIASVYISLPRELITQAQARLLPATEREPIRRMIQTAAPFAVFEFSAPPNQINFDGMAAEYTELPRPLMNPAIDVKNSRSYRISFEFLVAHVETIKGGKLVDGVYVPIHHQLKTLEQMANRPIPVRFENFDSILTSNTWYISDMSFNAVRYNSAGEITSAQVSMSFINFQQQTTRFISVPSISYKPKRKKTTINKKGDPDEQDQVTVEEIFALRNAANAGSLIAIQRLAELMTPKKQFKTKEPASK